MYVKSLVLTICLTLLPIQQPKEIAIVLDGQTVIMPLANAERLYVSNLAANDPKLKAALEIALGTAITSEVDKESLTVQEVERFRWHRRPLQWRAKP